jgi:hypothetical protein
LGACEGWGSLNVTLIIKVVTNLGKSLQLGIIIRKKVGRHLKLLTMQSDDLSSEEVISRCDARRYRSRELSFKIPELLGAPDAT